MARALWVNSQLRKVIAVDCIGLEDMRKYVGGSICFAMSWNTGDVLYVDDEGLLKPQDHFFMLPGCQNPLAGDGIIVGPEVEAEDKWWTENTTITIEKLKVTWMTREQAWRWAVNHGMITYPAFRPVYLGDKE